MHLVRRSITPVIILTAFLPGADADDAPSSAFSVSRWTVKQLTRFELSDKGRLRLARGHWDLATKRPLRGEVRESSPDDQKNRERKRLRTNRRRANDRRSAVVRLFSRISEENGGSGITTRRGSGHWKQFSYSLPHLSGTLTEQDDAVHLDLREQQYGMQTLLVEDSADITRLHYCSADGNVLHMQTSPGGIHIGASVSGSVKSFTGLTFSELAQKHPAWFRDELQPSFQGFVTLPLTDALQANRSQSKAVPQLPTIALTAADLAQEEVLEAFAPFLQFQMKGGQLRRNRFTGHPDVLEREIAILNREFHTALQRSVDRLRKQDAPQTQIRELEARMSPLNRGLLRSGDRAPALAARMQLMQPENTKSLGGDYQQFSLFMVAAGFSGSSNSHSNNNYHRHFSADQIHGRIRRQDDRVSVSTSDQEIDIHVIDDRQSTQLAVESLTALLYVRQSHGNPCIATLAGGGELLVLRGESLAAVVDKNEETWRQRFLPIFHRLRITGLDPFSEATVASVLERLQSDPPRRISDDKITGWTEWIAEPLLSDVGYLTILARRLEADTRNSVENRIEFLERS